MINGNNQYWQNAAMNIRKDGDEWRLAKDTVSNTYTPEDEGKVVSNGELVAQTAMPDEITDNGTIDTTLYDSVTVNVSGGGGGAGGTDVIFYDYDGTIVQTYSAADFANLSAMPENPTHNGLTAQGWNWTLADAKTYVATYGKLNIGQMYVTSDGKTKLYFTVTKNNLSTNLQLELGSDTELDVDWGDGSEHTIWTSVEGSSSKNHEYASAGRYVIAVEVITGEFYLLQESFNIYEIEIGNGVVGIDTSAFSGRYSLSSVTIPNSVTSIGNYAFYECYALSSVTIPSSVTSIGNNAFQYCSSLLSVTIPNSVTSISDYAFSFCQSLTSITIPDSVTSIGASALSSCTALTSITIPSGVTSIGDSAFNGCSSLSSITIPNGVTIISDSAFNSCYALSSVTIPSSVTSIGEYTFYYCPLSSITIPDSVTSIGGGAFSDCYSLSSVTIPDSVTNIDGSAFNNCYALLSVTFESSTPPNLDSYFTLPDTCTIRVPQGSLSAYTSAENYPNPSAYIYEEY